MKDQLEMFEALGIPWTEDCYLFCNDRGEPYNPSSVSYAFKRFAKRAGFPDLRLHDARHTHATIMLLAEVPMKTVQERLGHSKMSITGGHISPCTEGDGGGCGRGVRETVR